MAGMSFVRGRLVLLLCLGFAVSGCATTSDENSLSSESTHAIASVSRPSHSSVAATQAPNVAKRHFIEFRSRHALSYGHSLVVFGRMNAEGKMVDPEVAGLAPRSHDPNVYMLGHVIPVPSSTGWTDGDLEPEYTSAYWRVMLTEAEYNDVVAKIRRVQANSPLWFAPIYNCNAFVGVIARSMGYRTPFHLLMPQQYITTLRKMNGGPNAIGWTRPREPSGSPVNNAPS